MFDKNNCIRTMFDDAHSESGNIGCIGILKPDALNENYRTKENQLFRIMGGFGAYPDTMGNAIIGEFCVDGEHCRMERWEFIGIANEETVKYAKILEKKWRI